MSDIVERLRGPVATHDVVMVLEEAADEIERLRTGTDKVLKDLGDVLGHMKVVEAEFERVRADNERLRELLHHAGIPSAEMTIKVLDWINNNPPTPQK